MPDINVTFCRATLSMVHELVRKVGIRHPMKAAWVHRGNFDTWEFHGPGGFYWYGKAHNAYDARAKGWHSYLGYLANLEACHG